MNIFEKKLYQLVNLLSEEEGEIVKNKKTGNVYMVKSFDPEKHDKPTPDEIEKTKAANGGKIPTSDTPKQKQVTTNKPQEKPQPTAVNQPESPDTQPQKIKPTDFISSAEKDKEKTKTTSISNKPEKRPGADDAKLKNLMPGVDTSVPTLDKNPMARQKLSMKMGELADKVKNASSKEEADSIDACQVTVPGTNLYCDDNLNIPRTEMPQFKGKARVGSDADKLPKNKDNEVDGEAFFKKFLKDNNISVNNGKDDKGVEVPPDRMKATQRDMQASKILGMADGLEKDPENPNLTAPIMVSNDGYVLDGHHRWAAMILHNSKHPDKPIPLKATIIDKPIKDLVPIANKFADDMGIEKKSVGKSKTPETKPIAEKKITKLSEFLK